MRWQNLLFLAFLMWVMERVCAEVLYANGFYEILPWWYLVLLIGAAVGIAAGGYIINDYDIPLTGINMKIATKAAAIRAQYKDFKAMDALQLATAVISGCDVFLTNDKQLHQFKEVNCVTVEEWEIKK